MSNPLNSLPDIFNKELDFIFYDGKLIKQFNNKEFNPETGSYIENKDEEQYDIRILRDEFNSLQKIVGDLGNTRKFIVLIKSIPESVTIHSNDLIEFEEQRYKVKEVNKDPSNSIYEIMAGAL